MTLVSKSAPATFWKSTDAEQNVIAAALTFTALALLLLALLGIPSNRQ
jgi:hypothetical protein